jgi:diguanylate cyclase (GGDEF)-like protein
LVVQAVGASESWPAQQLAEFLAVLSVHSDPLAATRCGLERVAEVLDAEIGAVIREGCETISIGFPPDQIPTAELKRLAEREELWCELPPLGRCAVARYPLDDERLAWLLIARSDRALSGEEFDLLRGMARVLGLVRDMVGHRLLLERVSAIQRQIVRRSPGEVVLDAIVAGAAELTASEVAMMRRIDPDDLSQTSIVAHQGVDGPTLDKAHRVPSQLGAAGQAIQQDRLVVVEEYGGWPLASPAMKDSLKAVMATPVRERHGVVGSLSVASRQPGRRYSAAEQAALETFAEHASMALTDARMVQDAVHRSTHDPLTGLPNRALFGDRLREAGLRAESSGATTAVLFLDIDRFKTVNDSLGHGFGDELLVAAAGRLAACVRPSDTPARFGGDEFAVLAEDADEAAAGRIADRILKSFDEPFTVGGRRVHLGASIGITIVNRAHADVLPDADLAMYHAKAQGRGRYELFQPEMRTAVTERLELESELRGASDRGEMMLEYQPIVDLRTGRLACLEALVRWRHPRRGRLEPGTFISVAEETGEMITLGRWVMQSACDAAARWRQQTTVRPLRLSVNLSPIQLYDTKVVDEVREVLQATGLSPDALIIELTETVIMDDVRLASERLRQLKDLGVGLAIDDFGTGYCSLQYLRHFPIDYLKIAGSFLQELDGPGGDPSLTRGIIDLGLSFGLTVVAEGIERPEQRDLLLELGCDLGQGFLLARPQGPEGLAEILAQGSLAANGSAAQG